jgi:NAD(P)-dependent dehydrogenase (short-subunit alcohol dehydrogenase family)
MRALQKAALIGGGLLASAVAVQSLIQRARWFSYRNRVAIVAGGSRGLGLALARQLVDQGAKVAICARTSADVDAAVAELQASGGDALGILCDVRHPDEIQRLVRRVLERWERIDVLFNVAGIMEVGPLESMTFHDFQEAMDINCWGPLHTTLAVLPTMRRQGWGRIVNIASIGGKQAVPHMLPYDTSKFALVGLSNGLRTELAKDGILVTTANPTLMRTGSPRNATFKGKHREEYAWFSIGGALPIVSIDAERAAAQVLQACQNGEAEVYIANYLNPPVWAARLAPTLVTELFSIINRVLPTMGGIGQQRAFGYESQSAVSPSWATALGDAAAERHQEMRPRPAEHR